MFPKTANLFPRAFALDFEPIFKNELNLNCNLKIKENQKSFSKFRTKPKKENVVYNSKYIDMGTSPGKKRS